MAEWSGGERPRRRSQPAELDTRATRQVIRDLPDAPGAVGSPQIPGMTPDRGTVPGNTSAVIPRPTLGKRRPLSQLGTAEELIPVYTPSGEGGAWVAGDFDGAGAPIEEMRKVDPRLNTPHRPAPGYETARALAWVEERFAAIEAGVEDLALAAGLPMNAVEPAAASIAAIPTEATLLGMAGAASGSVGYGEISSGTWAGGEGAVPAAERAGSLTGLGAPAAALAGAAEALGRTPAAAADAGAAASTRSPLADAAPSFGGYAGVAGEVAAAPDAGHGAGAGMGVRGGMPLTGEAAALPLTPEGAVGRQAAEAARAGLPEAAPMPRDVMPGEAGGWLAQEQAIEGVVPGGGGSGRGAARGSAPDAADMGGDLQPGFTTGGAAREGGDGGWLRQEQAIEGIAAGAAPRGWEGPIPGGAVAHAGGAECPPEFPIKGNLPSRLYHLPGDFAYTATVPEFCFNLEAAATAAGFTRAPRRGAGGAEAGAGVEKPRRTRGGPTAAKGPSRGAAKPAAKAEPRPPAPAGAVRPRGKTCPKANPVKGNLQSGFYHRPEDPSYSVTIPEFCFATEGDARAAGFTLAGNAKQG
ncbi:MAG: hypothetical protein ACKOWF_02700 [Chloroflexota bacterium]